MWRSRSRKSGKKSFLWRTRLWRSRKEVSCGGEDRGKSSSQAEACRVTGERESCWGSVRSSPGSTSSTTRKEGLQAARIWGKGKRNRLSVNLAGSRRRHVSEFLVPEVWGGISRPGWQDHNAKDKNSPATLSATTRSPDSSTGLSGKLKVLGPHSSTRRQKKGLSNWWL